MRTSEYFDQTYPWSPSLPLDFRRLLPKNVEDNRPDQLKDLHVSHTLGDTGDWNTGTKDTNEVNKREVCECDG